jgi:hypothetical protein
MARLLASPNSATGQSAILALIPLLIRLLPCLLRLILVLLLCAHSESSCMLRTVCFALCACHLLIPKQPVPPPDTRYSARFVLSLA